MTERMHEMGLGLLSLATRGASEALLFAVFGIEETTEEAARCSISFALSQLIDRIGQDRAVILCYLQGRTHLNQFPGMRMAKPLRAT